MVLLSYRDVNFSKFFRGRAGHGGKIDFRHVAEQGGENSLCGGNPPQPKSVAEIRHGGKNRLGGILPWRKNIAVAENRRGGKKSPWRKKIAMAEKIAVAEDRHGGKNRRGGISPWRKNIAVAENRHGGKIFLYSAEFSQYTFHLIREANSLRQRNDKDDALEAKVGKISEKISVKNFGKNFRKISGKISEKIQEKFSKKT
jgi:hypothetical protein